MLLPSHELLLLKKSDSFLLLYHLILSSGVLSSLAEEDLLSLLVLDLNKPLLFDLLFLAEVDGLLDLLSLLVPLLPHVVDLFLVVLLHHLLHAKLLHLLLDLDLILLLESEHLGGPFLGLLNFLPGAHLLLLQQGDAVREQLGIALNTYIIVS